MIICDKCNRTIEHGNKENGIPNGVGFQLESGKMINLCSDCIELLGRAVAVGLADEFFKDLKVKL